MLELLAGAALRSLILTAAVGTGLRLRRTHNPHVLLAAWTIVLAASLLMPAAMRLTSAAVPQGIITVGLLPRAVRNSIGPDRHTGFMTSPAEPGMPASPSAALPSWREVASILYLAVFGALTIRLLAGLSLSWLIARSATPVREDWAGGFDVRASRRITTPATFGSIILVPDDHVAWSPARRLAVLAHEGAHVGRRDLRDPVGHCRQSDGFLVPIRSVGGCSGSCPISPRQRATMPPSPVSTIVSVTRKSCWKSRAASPDCPARF